MNIDNEHYIHESFIYEFDFLLNLIQFIRLKIEILYRIKNRADDSEPTKKMTMIIIDDY